MKSSDTLLASLLGLAFIILAVIAAGFFILPWATSNLLAAWGILVPFKALRTSWLALILIFTTLKALNSIL